MLWYNFSNLKKNSVCSKKYVFKKEGNNLKAVIVFESIKWQNHKNHNPIFFHKNSSVFCLKKLICYINAQNSKSNHFAIKLSLIIGIGFWIFYYFKIFLLGILDI